VCSAHPCHSPSPDPSNRPAIICVFRSWSPIRVPCGSSCARTWPYFVCAECWDAVLSCFFLDTAHNVIQYIRAIYRMLKPGGYLINIGPPPSVPSLRSRSQGEDDEYPVTATLGEVRQGRGVHDEGERVAHAGDA